LARFPESQAGAWRSQGGGTPQPFRSLSLLLPVLPLCALGVLRASALSLPSALSSCPDPSYRCSSLFIGGFSPVFSCPHRPFLSFFPLSRPKIRAFPKVFRCFLFLHRLIAAQNRLLRSSSGCCVSQSSIVPHDRLLCAAIFDCAVFLSDMRYNSLSGRALTCCAVIRSIEPHIAPLRSMVYWTQDRLLRRKRPPLGKAVREAQQEGGLPCRGSPGPKPR
jgi:hypothetical protein